MSIDATLKRLSWEFWVGASILVLALLGLALVPSQVLEPTFGSRSIAFSPKTFPSITLAAMALLGAAMAVGSALWRSDRSSVLPAGPLTTRVLAPMLIMLAYVLSLQQLGTIVASALAVAAIAYALGNRSWITVVSLAVVVPALIWLVFKVGLNVFLPEGTILKGLT